MKRFIIATLCALAFGCGSAPEEDLQIDDGVHYELNGVEISRNDAVANYYASIGESAPLDPGDVEIGSASEALYADDGFGAENVTQSQCLLSDSWGPKHECDFPLNKKYGLVIPSSGNQHGCDAQFVNGIRSGILLEGQDITSIGAGWQTGAANPGDAFAFWTVNCSLPGPTISAKSASSTIIDATPAPVGGFSCSSAGGGKNACKYQGGHIEEYQARIESDPLFASLTTSQKQRYIKNITRHEHGHTAGFGHYPCTSTELMCAGRNADIEGLNEYSLSAAQKTAAHRYSVNGSTPTP